MRIDESNAQGILTHTSEESGLVYCVVNLDCLEDLNHTTPTQSIDGNTEIIKCLIVATFLTTGSKVAIVVKELDGMQGIFERVGYATLDPYSSTFERMPLEYVIIV